MLVLNREMLVEPSALHAMQAIFKIWYRSSRLKIGFCEHRGGFSHFSGDPVGDQVGFCGRIGSWGPHLDGLAPYRR